LARTRDELARTQEELEMLAYVISHDLRAPIRHLISYSELLKDQLPELSEDGAQFWLNIQRSSQRLSDQTQSLVSYSRIGRWQVLEQLPELPAPGLTGLPGATIEIDGDTDDRLDFGHGSRPTRRRVTPTTPGQPPAVAVQFGHRAQRAGGHRFTPGHHRREWTGRRFLDLPQGAADEELGRIVLSLGSPGQQLGGIQETLNRATEDLVGTVDERLATAESAMASAGHILHDRLVLVEKAREKVGAETVSVSGIDDPRLDEILPGHAVNKLREDVEMVKGLCPEFDRQAYLEGHMTPVYFGSALNT